LGARQLLLHDLRAVHRRALRTGRLRRGPCPGRRRPRGECGLRRLGGGRRAVLPGAGRRLAGTGHAHRVHRRRLGGHRRARVVPGLPVWTRGRQGDRRSEGRWTRGVARRGPGWRM
ncbi:uncharacterized protein METZ01_LOCUS38877, partial [marine metagenome]